MPARGSRSIARVAAAIAFAIATVPASAADRVKVGFVSSLSGPLGVLGIDIRDAFNLYLKLNGGKLGGLPAEVQVVDDQGNPEVGKQAADRLVKRDRVDLMTGIVLSNVMLAVAPVAIDARTPYISANAGPSQLAGENCNPYYFVASWENAQNNAAAGIMANNRNITDVYLIAPNYPAGRDVMDGFKTTFKGKVNAEVYTRLGQLDFSAEIAQIRAAKPQAVFFFQPGAMGINFIKQFVAAGLSKDIPLLASGVVADEDMIRAVGTPMLGLLNTAHWAHDLDNAANRRFVPAFEKEYKRLPTVYAAQGWDTAALMDTAVRDLKGKVEDRQALVKALRAARLESVRGPFRWNRNQHPIQNYYLRIIGTDNQGRITNKMVGVAVKDLEDPNAARCRMPW